MKRADLCLRQKRRQWIQHAVIVGLRTLFGARSCNKMSDKSTTMSLVTINIIHTQKFGIITGIE